MILYEYRCRVCGHVELSEERGDDLRHRSHRRETPTVSGTIVQLCTGLLGRVWSVQVAPVMQEHWNNTVQRPVSSTRQFERELRRASDEATERTGIEHRFAPVDPGDVKSLGVTSEGLDATNGQRVAEGRKAIAPD